LTRHRGIGSRSRSRRLIGALALGGVVATGCTDAAGYDLDYFMGMANFVSTMRSTVAYESHTLPRLPPVGTVPVASPIGEILPPFGQAALDSVGAVLANPLPPSTEVLARGSVVYLNQCSSCHGMQGEGNGPVVGNGRFPLGPAVNTGAVAARADGYLYGVVRVGRGLMPAYGERITHNDRWAVVHYMRILQQQSGAAPPPADVAAPPVDMQQAVEPNTAPAPQ
jgi:mono/diheme cytochrome c family protein